MTCTSSRSLWLILSIAIVCNCSYYVIRGVQDDFLALASHWVIVHDTMILKTSQTLDYPAISNVDDYHVLSALRHFSSSVTPIEVPFDLHIIDQGSGHVLIRTPSSLAVVYTSRDIDPIPLLLNGKVYRMSAVFPTNVNTTFGRVLASKLEAERGGLDQNIIDQVDAVDADRYRADLVSLTVFNRNSKDVSGVNQARDWLVSELQSLSSVENASSFQFDMSVAQAGLTGFNVVGYLPGKDPECSNQLFIVGAHYDTLPDPPSTSPGAEDNGSGTVGVLAMARVFDLHPPAATVLFVLFSGEEQGLYGSTFLAQQLVDDGEAANVQLVLILDMVSFDDGSGTDPSVLLETNAPMLSVIQPLFETASPYVPEVALTTSDAPFGSDHVPFINRNILCLLTIDSDWDTYTPYHQSTDTVAATTASKGPLVVKLNVAALNVAMQEYCTGDGVVGDGAATPSSWLNNMPWMSA